jgi:ABC-type transporter Mla subunit MlaD
MPIRHILVTALALILLACTLGDLHLNLRLDRLAGLRPEAPVLLGERVVGKVTAVEPDNAGGYLAKLEIDSEFRESASQDARFIVIRTSGATEQSHVELRPGQPGSPPLPEDATVRGWLEPELLFPPLGEMLRGFTESLGILRDQVERFRSEIQRLPRSEDARRLQDEWTRLMDEMKKAQETAGDSLKRELIPKLQQQLDALDKQLRELDSAPQSAPQPMPRRSPPPRPI